MRTFFHPAPAGEETPALLRLWRLLRDRSRQASAALMPAARRVVPLVRRHPKVAIFTALGVGAALFAGMGGADGMPGVAKAGRKALPAPVEEAAREVFDGRFVKHGDSHYTVRVVCMPNVLPVLSGIPFLGGDGTSRTKAPMLTHMELIEIKNLRTEVHADDLTKSDELNDVRWKGRLMVRGEVERRRPLDLTPWAERIVKHKDAPPLPWVDAKIGFEEGSFLDEKETADLKGSKDHDIDPLATQQALGGIIGAATGLDLSGEAANWLKGGSWADWGECGERSYQTSDIQLRGTTARISTLESLELAMDGEPEVTLFALHANNFFQMLSLTDAEEINFLVKPDLKSLREAGLLK